MDLAGLYLDFFALPGIFIKPPAVYADGAVHGRLLVDNASERFKGPKHIFFTDAVCGPFFYDLSPYVLGIGHLAQDHGTSVGLIVQIEIFGYPGRLSCADGQDAGGHRV